MGEHQGKYKLYAAQSPEILNGLRKVAVVESTESSNRLEGVVVDHRRLKSIVLKNATPQNRSEQEVAGAKTARVQAEILNRTAPFTITNIDEACPGVSRETVRSVLRAIKAEGLIAPGGKGRGAQWIPTAAGA